MSIMLLGLASALPDFGRRLKNIDAALNELEAGTARELSVTANSELLNSILDGIAKEMPTTFNPLIQENVPEEMPLAMPAGDGGSACLIPGVGEEEDAELDDMTLDTDEVDEEWGAATKWVSRTARTVVDTGKKVVDKVTSKCICEGSAKYSFDGVSVKGLQGMTIGEGTVTGTAVADDGTVTSTLTVPVNVPTLTVSGGVKATVGACGLDISQGAAFSAPISVTGKTALEATMSVKMELTHLCADISIKSIKMTVGTASVGHVSISFGGNALQKVLASLASKVSDVIATKGTSVINAKMAESLDPESDMMKEGLVTLNTEIVSMDGTCKWLKKGDTCDYWTPNPYCESPLECTSSKCVDPPPKKGEGEFCWVTSECSSGCKCSWGSCKGSCA